MKWRFFSLRALGVGALFFIPFIALAAGIVPDCGNASGFTPGTTAYLNAITSCNLCDFGQLIQNIINFLIGLTIPFAVVLFAYAGVLMYTNAGNPKQVTRAKSIFVSVLKGFGIALCGYLLVQTVLSTLVKGDFFFGGHWNNLQCVSNDQRPRTGTINDVFNNLLPSVEPVQSVTTSGTASDATPTPGCPAGYTLGTVSPEDPTATCTAPGKASVDPTYTGTEVASVSQTYTGACSSFGLSAQQACIAQNESTCNPNVGSSVDIGSDGNSVSWGLFQVNLSANPVQCTNINGGQKLNCPNAFSGGAYTAGNHATYVTETGLFNQCKAAVQNVQCSLQMQQQLQAKANGSITAWGDAARRNCSNLQ